MHVPPLPQPQPEMQQQPYGRHAEAIPLPASALEANQCCGQNYLTSDSCPSLGNDVLWQDSGQIDVAWRPHEDATILEAVSSIGERWTSISQLLMGRSSDAVRTRFNSLQESLLKLGRAQMEFIKVGYKCSRCGQLKKKHQCTWEPGQPTHATLKKRVRQSEA